MPAPVNPATSTTPAVLRNRLIVPVPALIEDVALIAMSVERSVMSPLFVVSPAVSAEVAMLDW